ncbi:GNAT family acetyltransferase [Bacillus mycoides]|uniref:GNAT family acetyltransferase n=1 Tax=Bacillus mycoides TaxID=1405 RepID=UPI003D65A189
MALEVYSLTDVLNAIPSEEEVNTLLRSFESLHTQDSSGSDDVESFLHNKAIMFEKMHLARTYLVMSSYQSRPFIAGYFSISNKPLIIPRKHFIKMAKSLQKRLMGFGHRTEQSSYEIKGVLLGQLGKNYNEVANKAKACCGKDLLELAYEKIREVHRIVGGRVLYLECEPHVKILDFYKSNGFNQLEEFESENDYCIMVKQMQHIA